MMPTFSCLYAVCICDLCNVCDNLPLSSTTSRFLFSLLRRGNITMQRSLEYRFVSRLSGTADRPGSRYGFYTDQISV